MDDDTLIGAFWVCGIVAIICFSFAIGFWLGLVCGWITGSIGAFIILPSAMLFDKWIDNR